MSAVRRRVRRPARRRARHRARGVGHRPPSRPLLRRPGPAAADADTRRRADIPTASHWNERAVTPVAVRRARRASRTARTSYVPGGLVPDNADDCGLPVPPRCAYFQRRPPFRECGPGNMPPFSCRGLFPSHRQVAPITRPHGRTSAATGSGVPAMRLRTLWAGLLVSLTLVTSGCCHRRCHHRHGCEPCCTPCCSPCCCGYTPAESPAVFPTPTPMPQAQPMGGLQSKVFVSPPR